MPTEVLGKYIREQLQRSQRNPLPVHIELFQLFSGNYGTMWTFGPHDTQQITAAQSIANVKFLANAVTVHVLQVSD